MAIIDQINGLDLISQTVIKVSGVDFLNDPSRRRKIIDARVLFGAIAKQMTKLPFKTIGNFMNKDHTTVVHYCRVVEDFCMSDKNFKTMYDQCIEDLKQVTGGDIELWFKMNYHLKKYKQLKKILQNG